MARTQVSFFEVWCAAMGTVVVARDGRVYGSPDAGAAARVHAHHHYRNVGEDFWPLTMHVRDLQTNKLYEVLVSRRVVYEFDAAEPKEIT